MVFFSDRLFPNLFVQDESNRELSLVPTNNIILILKRQIEFSNNEQKNKLESFIEKILNDELHVIWIKIPKSFKFYKNETRVITFKYSPIHYKNNSTLNLKIENEDHPLYYTLYYPNNFDVKKMQYNNMENNKLVTTDKSNKYVKIFKIYNSQLFKIKPDIKSAVKISYSFKPTRQASISTYIGLGTLCALGIIMLGAKILDLSNYLTTSILEKNIEIGIVIVAGSLVLPRLTRNDSIRLLFSKWYTCSIIIGIMVMIW